MFVLGNEADKFLDRYLGDIGNRRIDVSLLDRSIQGQRVPKRPFLYERRTLENKEIGLILLGPLRGRGCRLRRCTGT